MALRPTMLEVTS